MNENEQIDTDSNLSQELTDILIDHGASVNKQSIIALQIYILKRDVKVIASFCQRLEKAKQDARTKTNG